MASEPVLSVELNTDFTSSVDQWIIATLVFQRKRLYGCTVNPGERANQPIRHKKIKSSTKMILVINIYFILTTLSCHFKRVLKSQAAPSTDEKDQVKRVLQERLVHFVLYLYVQLYFVLCEWNEISRRVKNVRS